MTRQQQPRHSSDATGIHQEGVPDRPPSSPQGNYLTDRAILLLADPKLLSPAERLAAFGRLFAQAVERHCSRQRLPQRNKNHAKQKGT